MSLTDKLKDGASYYFGSVKDAARQIGLRGSLYAGLGLGVLFAGGCDPVVDPPPEIPNTPSVIEVVAPEQVRSGGIAGETGIFEATFKVVDPDTIRSVLVYRGDRESPDFFELVEGKGRTSLEFKIREILAFPESELPRREVYKAKVADERDDVVEKSFGVDVVAPGNVDAWITWNAPEEVFNKEYWNDGVFKASLRSFSLDSLVTLSVNWSDGESEVYVPEEFILDTVYTRLFEFSRDELPKGLEVFLSAVDKRGNVTEKGPYSVFVDKLPVSNVSVKAEDFVSGEPDFSASIRFWNESVGWDTVLHAVNRNGLSVVEGVLPKGVYDWLAMSELSYVVRTLVHKDFYDDPEQFRKGLDISIVTTAGGDYVANTGLVLEGDIETIIQAFGEPGTIYDGRPFLEAISSGFLRTGSTQDRIMSGARLDQTQYLLRFNGNPEYPLNWSVHDPTFVPPNDGPPGVVSPLDEYGRSIGKMMFLKYVEVLKESLYDDLLGIIPYDLVVKDSVDMKELEEYVVAWGAGGGQRPDIAPNPNVFVFSHSGVGRGGTAGTYIDDEYKGSNHSFWFNVRGFAFVPFDDGPGWFSNECGYWNSNSDYVPPIGSVRDYHQANPPFPVIYGGVYRENDMWVGKLLSNFNAWAGKQRYRAKDGSVRRGNNIHLKPGGE